MTRGLTDCGLTKSGAQRAMLMETLCPGGGDANAHALQARPAAAPAPAGADPLDAIHAGQKALLRALHERLRAEIGYPAVDRSSPRFHGIDLVMRCPIVVERNWRETTLREVDVTREGHFLSACPSH